MNDRSHRKMNYETLDVELKLAQAQFIEWLCGDRPAGETQAQLAARLDVNPGTLSKWKKDPAFCTQWEKRMRETHAHPDKQHALLEKLYDKALTTGDSKDIESYFRLIDRMTPEKIQISGADEAAEMSEEELREAAENLGVLRAVGD